MVAIQFDQVDVHPKQKVIDLELDDVRVRTTYLLPYLLPLCSLPFQQLVSIHLLHKPGKKPLDIHEKRQNKGGERHNHPKKHHGKSTHFPLNSLGKSLQMYRAHRGKTSPSNGKSTLWNRYSIQKIHVNFSHQNSAQELKKDMVETGTQPATCRSKTVQNQG